MLIQHKVGSMFKMHNSSEAFTENLYVATGGTITTCGDCKIHTFTGPGTFTVNVLAATAANNVVSYVVAGGGGGGGGSGGAGGGAGGFREYKSPVNTLHSKSIRW